MSRRRGYAAAAVALGLLAAPLAVVRAGTTPACTQPMAGGDWATYGQDLHGAQRQDQEQTIGVDNVGNLEQRWVTADTGYQSPPPIVAGGCAFINTKGHIEAFDLETGQTVWKSSGADTSGTFAVTVADGRVHV